ncbi:MAG: EAL domain-containing protein [Pyrinomonadaceae bacterium]
MSTENEENSERSLYEEWLGDWAGKLTIAFSLFLVFHILYVLFQWGGESDQSLMSNLITIAIYLGPCLIAARAAFLPELPGRLRCAWAAIALADLAFALGSAIWIYFENYLGEQPFPSLADVGYLLYYPLMLFGLLMLVQKFRSAEEKLNFWLDAGVIIIAGSVVVWYFLIRPMSDGLDGDTLKTVLTIAYPVSDLVLLLGISSLLFRKSETSHTGPVNLLMLAVILTFLADFCFSYQTLNGTYKTGAPIDALFTMACYPVMVAAHLQYILAKRRDLEVVSTSPSKARFFWVPYLGVAIVYLVILNLISENPIFLAMIMVAAAVTSLVIFRQFMFVRENIKAADALTEIQERIQGIYSASTDAIGLATFGGYITEVNDSFLRLTGMSRDEIIGQVRYTDFLPEGDLDTTTTPDDALEQGHSLEFERNLMRKDGSVRSVTTTLYTVNGASGTPAAVALVIRDVSERRSLEQKLSHQALHDPLTGLANRLLIRQRLEGALSRAKRLNTRVALLFIDLDNFKTVNDTLGHKAGDTLLVAIAERLKACLRASDTPSRLGGDEFAVLIEDIDADHPEIGVAARLLSSIAAPVNIFGKDVFVGSSIGIALSGPASDPEDLLRDADVAMYVAKKNGKNRYEIFDPAMGADIARRAELLNELRSSLKNNELYLRYQPIVDLASEQVTGLEALLRWRHPSGAEIPPSEFIPLAEEANLISEIGKMVLEVACTSCSRWSEEFPHLPDLAISVNISSRQFLDRSFTETLVNALEAAGLSPDRLILEITESAMLSGTEEVKQKLQEIRKMGIRLAIDDFGTGYSSLGYLQKFEIDILKIDRSFVEEISHGRERTAMAHAIVSMSHTLKLSTVAEGIETVEQAKTLRELGCDRGQGFYFAKPLTFDEAVRYLERSRESERAGFFTGEGVSRASQYPTALQPLPTVA